MIFKGAGLRLFILLLSVLLPALSGCKRTALDIGDNAPDFLLRDLSGQPQSLSAQMGNVVVVEFWATWCPPCRQAIPEMASLHEKYSGRGVVVLAISVDDDASALPSFIKQYNITYPVLFDDKGIRGLYGVRGIPTTFIIGKGQRIANKHRGYSDGMFNELSKEIEGLL